MASCGGEKIQRVGKRYAPSNDATTNQIGIGSWKNRSNTCNATRQSDADISNDGIEGTSTD
jgi:hypothetical protein